MSDAEWASVRDLLPVPGWLAGRSGRPKGYCHRQRRGAIPRRQRHQVAGDAVQRR
ncbi:conserved hypothetical protein [Streptomyces viridosporus ATCC 14672]|uniref:Transposase n=1 Tax=Streptomyces viridosporus (strain ATCC 14672 / DSM 40746 / JCM 4963 / KCTC 9882 / NRRL B-12104 / FH 1290) TaxID=566461 RepID=D5ZTH1_STRV1|nr:conserved hypothetical protein [Streptomyces viridosporus ATCC 14672]